MNSKSTNICVALKKDGDRCSFKGVDTTGLCKRHMKMANITKYDDVGSNAPIKIICNNSKLIPLENFPRLLLSNTRLKDIKYTLTHFNIPIIGKKQDNFEKLKTLYLRLYPYNTFKPKLKLIQRAYRNYLSNKIFRLSGKSSYSLTNCVNHTDIYTFDSMSNIPDIYVFIFEDSDKNIYSFDIRSLNKLLKHSTQNPYTRTELNSCIINNFTEYIRLLTIINIKIQNEPEELNTKYALKRRVVKIFQDMDNLDQYTNPSWFLDLTSVELCKFYKETEDLFNYRLNLSIVEKKKIYPLAGSIFEVHPNSITPLDNKEKLQRLCLNFMEKLIYSAEKRVDRIRGCMYLLIGFVIVSPNAATALPSYHTMITGEPEISAYYDLHI